MAAKPTRVIMRGCLVTREGMQARRLIGVVESPSYTQPLGSVVYVKKLQWTCPTNSVNSCKLLISELSQTRTHRTIPSGTLCFLFASCCPSLIGHLSLLKTPVTIPLQKPPQVFLLLPHLLSHFLLHSSPLVAFCILSQKLSFGSPVITITE
ncbi:Hypothetical predicted protein [Prunus dulcis]|uniref:Uncharacterized protein n=1 Tax=Prunus dulcis TaxID=3755 RepID=A0A5E4E8B0_PRUDU|nr:hypothetical protein L3X38_007211 [Prunus dulcis]VVA11915.1 Hypothetical predicted protein [Prunus dulcis]